MVEQKLAAHIKERLDKQATREEIESELAAVGWSRKDISAAFADSSIVPESSSFATAPSSTVSPDASQKSPPSALDAPPLSMEAQPATTTQTPAAQVSDMSNQNASTSSGDGGGAAIPAAAGNKLPGIFALLKGGFAIYKDRLSVLVSIGGMQILFWLSLVAVMIVGRGMLETSLSSVPLTIALGIVAGMIFLLLVWIMYWIMLANLQAIHGYKEKVTFKEAFGSSRSRVWSFLWILIVMVFVSWGGMFIFSILPSAVLLPLGFITPLALIIPGIYFAVSIAALALMFGVWFIFSYWIFLTESLRGIHALVASRELVRGRFWSIFWRGYGVIFVIGIGVLLLNLILMVTLSSIPGATSTISMIVSALFFTPFAFAVMYFFYENVRLQVPTIPESPPRVHKSFVAYAIASIVGVFVIGLILLIITLSSLNRARHLGNDAVVTANVNIIRTELLIYYSDHNSYPVLLKQAAQTDPTIASVLQQFKENNTHYTYQGTVSSYTFCAARSNGSQFCADSTGSTFTKAANDVGLGLQNTTTAVSSPSQLKTYTNTKYGFSFQYPADLSVKFVPKSYLTSGILEDFAVYDASYVAPKGATGADVRSQLRSVVFLVYAYSAQLLNSQERSLQLNSVSGKLPVKNASGSSEVYYETGVAGPYLGVLIHDNRYIVYVYATQHNSLAESTLSTFRFTK